MKAQLLIALDSSAADYWNRECEIARSGKWIDLGDYKPKVTSIVWGLADQAMLIEAKTINMEMKALRARRYALNAKLKATQPALLAQAAKVPMSPKVVEPIRMTSDML